MQDYVVSGSYSRESEVQFVRISLVVGLVGGVFACGETDEPKDPCAGVTGECVQIFPSATVQDEAQTALINAQPGDTIAFMAGVHEFTRGLSLDVAGVTIRGAGMDHTTLSFANQTDGAQGLLVTADDFIIEDIAVEDTAGDAIKVEGVTGVFFRRTRVEWTGGALSTNGAYGLYPVQCTNVLIEDSVAIGASDAGIYVGQSTNIIVRRNRAEFNVAGIEIENSVDADVYDNVATNNTGGLLVFNLPGLPMKRGERTRIYNNDVYSNNTANFAPPGNIVGKVPKGTGFAAIAAHNVEIFGNSFRDNQTGNLAIISYFTTEIEYDDPEYDPYSDSLYIHDNEFVGGGTEPVDELGFVLVQAIITIWDAPFIVPDIVIDGFVNPVYADKSNPGQLAAPYQVCVQNNGDADFINLDKPNDHANVTVDAAPHDCTHPGLTPVSIPGVE